MADFLIIDDNKKTWNNTSVDNWKTKFNSASFIDKINDTLMTFQTIKTQDKVIFFRLMSTMTNAWMWVLKSIIVLEKQEKNPVLKQILNTFIRELKEWKNLSECMEMFPKNFTEAEIWIIKSWEKTWQLNVVLDDLATQIEKISSISWKIKSAMMYPAFIILVVIWVVFVMMVAIVPKLLDIFDDKSSLPWSTKILIFFSDFFSNYWYFLVAWAVLIYIAIKIWKQTPDGKYIYDEIMLKIPVFWGINRKLVLSKFSRVFAWLLTSWVSIVESLKITSQAVWNEVYKQRTLLLAEDIKWGIKMWESLDWDKLFPEMMTQMIHVWEDTAKLDHTIIKVADFYDEQVDNTIWVLNKLLEPFIIVTLAIIVWFIAMWIMQPIMGLADVVSSS